MAHSSSPVQGPSFDCSRDFAKVVISRGPSPNRRSSSTSFEHRYPCASPHTSRRFSNPTTPNAPSHTSICGDSRNRSPSDPQVVGERNNVSNHRRRFSQPAASFSYTNSSSLIRHERESYSSLNYLPEVRAYLRFMEDDTSLPHRSNSFNGRNSSRRSSFNRRKRSLSRPRTPTPTPANSFHLDYPTVFDQTDPPNQFYGRYLTPQRSTERSANRLSVDYGTSSEPIPYSYGSREELPPPSYSDYLTASIRTTFI